LKAMHGLDPSYELAMLWGELPADWLEQVAAIPASAIHLHYRALSFNILDRAREKGIVVRTWTCNEPAQMAPFWDEGLGGVITDDPSLFLGWAAGPPALRAAERHPLAHHRAGRPSDRPAGAGLRPDQPEHSA